MHETMPYKVSTHGIRNIDPKLEDLMTFKALASILTTKLKMANNNSNDGRASIYGRTSLPSGSSM